MVSRWIALIEREEGIVIPCMREDDECLIMIFETKADAYEHLQDVPLYQAFGGYAISLDEAAE
ncbi:hypothetical protein D3C76_1415130 [compost metagenome]